MKRINISVNRPSVTLQLFDKWIAYRQSLDQHYKSDVLITFEKKYQPDCLNIWFDTMSEKIDNSALEFDLIFLCNTGEPIAVSTPVIYEMSKLDKVYLCADGYVTQSHPLYHKIIWHPHDILNCNDYYTRPFYPQYYTLHDNTDKNQKQGIVGINGSNRSWRHHFWKMLQIKLPNLTVRNVYPNILKTTDSFWESNRDTEYRDFVNDLYEGQHLSSAQEYYDDSVSIGIDQKFGLIPPGYFFLDEYFENQCIVFPETTWQNNELCLTEKGLKCFFSRTFPMPVGGANLNQLYNQLGFFTAWNLLPEHLQSYDGIEDHQQRYSAQIDSIVWLWNNQDVLHSEYAKSLLEQNLINSLSNTVDHAVIKKFDRWMADNFL